MLKSLAGPEPPVARPVAAYISRLCNEPRLVYPFA